MPRTYLRALAVLGMGLVWSATVPTGAVWARSLFDSKPLSQERFAVLGRPVGRDNWKLLVLEQIKQRPRCWTPRPDGLIDPTLNSFNFAGICSRYLDSNGYSLRTGGSDTDRSFRLRVENDRQGLVLSAMDPNRGVPIVVARANAVKRDRDAFVKLTLEPGWSLERRAYQGRTLSHVYFAHADSTAALLAKAGASTPSPGLQQLRYAPTRPPAVTNVAYRPSSGNGPIRLQVIPFRP